MRRNFRASALAAVGGLLMLAPASTAFATSDVYAPIYPPTGSQATPSSAVFRDVMTTTAIVDLSHLRKGSVSR